METSIYASRAGDEVLPFEQFFIAHKTLHLNSLKCPFVVVYSITFQLCIATQLSACYNIQELEWWFWLSLSLCISLSFTLSPSLLLFMSLPFLAYSASPQAKSWSIISCFLPISSLHTFLRLSAESLPGALLLSAIGWKDRTMKEKRAIAQNGKVGYNMERWTWRSAGKWLQRKMHWCESLLRFRMFLFEENQRG